MKPIFCILVFVSFFMLNPVNGQTWERFFGEAGKLDTGRDVLESYDKGYCILGRYDYKYTWLIKTDVNGIYLWDKIIEAEYGTTPNNMVQTSDGGLLIVGGAAVFENIIDPFILKLNACGEKEWCRILRKPGQLAFAMNVVELDDGSIMVQTMYMEDFSNIEDIHIYKFDPYGNLLWRNAYASKLVHPLLAVPMIRSMKRTSDNGLMLIGECYYPNPWNPNGIKGIRSMFVKIDSLGNEEWLLPTGLNDTVYSAGVDMIELQEENYFGAGTYIDGEYLRPYLVKFDNYGNELGYCILDDQYLNSIFEVYGFHDILRTNTNSEYHIDISGIEEENPDMPRWGSIITDINCACSNLEVFLSSKWIQKMDRTFNQKFILASSYDSTTKSNSDIYLYKLNNDLEYDTLYPGNYTYDSLCGNLPIQPGFISLNSCEVIVGTEEIPTPKEYYAGIQKIPIKAYPNPASDWITFAYENTEHHKNVELRCFNIMGTEIHKEKIYTGQKESKLNVGSWSEGIYIAMVYSNNMPAGRCKFVLLR